MPPASSVTFSWVPGTMDQVRFSTGERSYTVLLKDVQQLSVHSAADLYLKGRVVLPITAAHHAELTGHLALTSGVRRVSAAPAT
ncbi:hypothetical protein [Deinococcus multiflagellatus]|uniref:hypothetical protein n=1 Tax=Deinococcus multiflagellatus TaxID=1656887 RepID=UPI001CCEBF20|nr:hypothetical protein [Deinococcus multiflagellatus]MBZ9713643.1 hypothetical protein [Deinococcus multiflagellatus]